MPLSTPSCLASDIIERFRSNGTFADIGIASEKIEKLIRGAQLLCKEEPNTVNLRIKPGGSLILVGDLHGQSRNLYTILQRCDLPSPANAYLFNGDFVDKGPQSQEVILVLLALKILYTNSVVLLRGNHESKHTNKEYGFRREIRIRSGIQVFEMFSEFFRFLPLACVVEGGTRRVFVVHGGIPVIGPDPLRLEDINKLNRQVEPVQSAEDAVTQLLWNDPCEEKGTRPSQRGRWGRMFGPDVTDRFLAENGLTGLIRSHQDVYSYEDQGRCCTVFSGHSTHVAYLIFDDKMERNTGFHQFEDDPSDNYRWLGHGDDVVNEGRNTAQ